MIVDRFKYTANVKQFNSHEQREKKNLFHCLEKRNCDLSYRLRVIFF